MTDRIDRRGLLAGAGVGIGASALALVGGASPAGAAPSPRYHNVKTDNSAHGHPNAVGNGTADDTAAVQGALDLALYGHGDCNVWFPPGEYKVTAPLTVQTNVSLVGVGSGFDPRSGAPATAPKSMINGSTIRSGPVLMSPAGANGVSIINMQVKGAPAGSCTHPTLLLRKGHRHLVVDSRFLEGGWAAVQWNEVSVSAFVRNWVGGQGVCARGLVLTSSPDNTIEGNQMTTGSGYTSKGLAGDVLIVSGDHNVIRGNFIFYGDRGVVLGGNRHVFDANRVDTNWREGVFIDGDGHSVVGNVVHTNGRGGMGSPAQPRVAGIRIDTGHQFNHVVGNATRMDNLNEAPHFTVPCQRPGVQNASGNTTNEIVASGPVWT